MTSTSITEEVDAVVIVAGFAGLGMNRRLRDEMGLTVRVFEAGSDVGGTWYWNRYPGARCDSESFLYCLTFDKGLMQDWNWSGKYPEQPEILRYLSYVADRFDLRRNMSFNTRVTGAHWDDVAGRWTVTTDQGTFSIGTDGNWSFQVNSANADVQGLGVGESMTKSFTVTSADGTATRTADGYAARMTVGFDQVR